MPPSPTLTLSILIPQLVKIMDPSNSLTMTIIPLSDHLGQIMYSLTIIYTTRHGLHPALDHRIHELETEALALNGELRWLDLDLLDLRVHSFDGRILDMLARIGTLGQNVVGLQWICIHEAGGW